MGAFHFIKTLKNYNENLKDGQKYIKPIVGCELNVCENHLDKSNRDNGYQMVFLAKNKNGFRNLSKLSSIANIEGFYYVPRIDKEILKTYLYYLFNIYFFEKNLVKITLAEFF